MRYFILFFALLGITGCNHRSVSNENITEDKPETAVTLTHITFGKIRNNVILSATTVYQNKSVISSPIAGFITTECVRPGSIVEAGQPVFYLESKEQRVLSSPDIQKILVQAEKPGIVLEVQQHSGNFISEGTALCTIAETASLVFELHVPYELLKFVIPGKKCTLILPDGKQLEATIEVPLVTMNVVSQSLRIVARARSPFLPEGMNVKVLIPTDENPDRQEMILPKNAVQSNEQLTAHWIMKLVNDSLAVKVPVEVGNSDTGHIEIRASSLLPSDRIVLTGSYALEDSSRVVIVK